MPKTYAVKEIFATLQGEGALAGTAAIFVRFAGCNLWSGAEEHRERDAERTETACPRWCDTDFVGGARMSAAEIAADIARAAGEAGMAEVPLIVMTGGEPLLQLDPEVVACAVAAGRGHGARPTIAIETNGTQPIGAALRRAIGWLCVSPKTDPANVFLRDGDELKVVFPGNVAEPEAYATALGPFRHYMVSPLARVVTGRVGASLLDRDHIAVAARYCMEHPRWRLSIQAHKVANLP